MICLGFSTSTDSNSLCLHIEKPLTPLSWDRKDQKSDALTEKIKTYLHRHKITFSNLELIAVDKGPGSFTGCRVAVNVAKTLAYDLNLKIFEASSLELLAHGYDSKAQPVKIFTILDAHRSLFYFQVFEKNEGQGAKSQTSIQALSLEQILTRVPQGGSLVLLGNVKPEIFSQIRNHAVNTNPDLKVIIPKKNGVHFPSARTLVGLAVRGSSASYRSWEQVEPSYIRAPEAYEKLFSNT